MEEKYLYEKNKLTSYIGKELYKKLKEYNAIVAGGTITSIFTNNEINDIDVYFKCKEDAAEFIIDVAKNNWILAKTDKAFLFRYGELDVQAIYFKFFDNANEIFGTFDFTVCMGAYDFAQEEFVLHEDFLKHNSQRILSFSSSTAFPIISALRIKKYSDKGYYIGRAEYIKIMLTICNLKIETVEDLKKQIGGMYGEDYCELIKQDENEDFDLLAVIKKIAELQNENHAFKSSESAYENSGDWEKFVYDIFGITKSLDNSKTIDIFNL